MRTRSKLLLAGLTATLLLAIGVAGASAGRLSITNANKTFRVTWSSLELQNQNITTIRCPITMEGSFHSATIQKTLRALIGHVSRATVGNSACTSGHATVEQANLPWHVQYRGFTGSLPTINGVVLGLVNAKFRVESSGGLRCTTTTTETEPAQGIAETDAAGRITGMRADESVGIELEGSFVCEIGGRGFFRGTGTVRLLGSATTAITVRLI